MSPIDVLPTKVKWGKEMIELEVIVSDGVAGFKKQLQEKTNVPVDRMKLMPKSKGLWKGVLRDDCDMSSLDLSLALKKSNPVQVMMMGSAAALTAPATKTVFLEDLAPEEAAKASNEPAGLVNMGNTCYLNSVTQCLKAVPTFRDALARHGGGGGRGGPLLRSLRDTYAALDASGRAVPPASLVAATKASFPQFAQTDASGRPQQQDAEEFLSGLLTAAAAETTGRDAVRASLGLSADAPDDETAGAGNNAVDAVFGLRMEETLTCDEFAAGETTADDDDDDQPTEPPVVNHDLHRKLVCNIQGGADGAATVNVNHVHEGVSLSLNGKIEKRSELLGRDAVWTRRQRIARLPPVLVVQFGRFYWKATPNSADQAGVKCKVMKPVTFNDTLDVYEFCNERLQTALKVRRDAAVREEEERLAAKEASSTTTKEEEEDAHMEDVEDEEEQAALRAALAMSVESDAPAVGPGLPPDFRGLYELFAVVTHKGRNADGGHYMGWVKADEEEQEAYRKHRESAPVAEKKQDGEDLSGDRWYVFDDDEVSPCTGEEVMKLKGGGDYHMSYLNFYRARK